MGRSWEAREEDTAIVSVQVMVACMTVGAVEMGRREWILKTILQAKVMDMVIYETWEVREKGKLGMALVFSPMELV